MNKKRIENKKNTPTTTQIGSMFAESLLPALKEGHTRRRTSLKTSVVVQKKEGWVFSEKSETRVNEMSSVSSQQPTR